MRRVWGLELEARDMGCDGRIGCVGSLGNGCLRKRASLRLRCVEATPAEAKNRRASMRYVAEMCRTPTEFGFGGASLLCSFVIIDKPV